MGFALAIPFAGLLLPVVLTVLSWWLVPSDAGAQAVNTTETFSTSSETHVEDRTVDQNSYQTRVTAVRDGAIVYDQSTDAAPGSAAVSGLEAEALAALAGPGCTASGFATTDSSRTQTGSSADEQTATIAEEVTVEETIGPASIIIGDRDAGGTPFFVVEGSINFNINVHTTLLVTRTTTNAYLNEATRQAQGTCTGPEPPPDPPGPPEPSAPPATPAATGAGPAAGRPVAGMPVTAG